MDKTETIIRAINRGSMLDPYEHIDGVGTLYLCDGYGLQGRIAMLTFDGAVYLCN